jgi:hypothetical protein
MLSRYGVEWATCDAACVSVGVVVGHLGDGIEGEGESAPSFEGAFWLDVLRVVESKVEAKGRWLPVSMREVSGSTAEQSGVE